MKHFCYDYSTCKGREKKRQSQFDGEGQVLEIAPTPKGW